MEHDSPAEPFGPLNTRAASRGSSSEPLLRAALDAAHPGVILLDTTRAVRLVTRGAAELLGLPYAARDCGTPVMALLARSHWLDEPALMTLSAAFLAPDETEPRRVLVPVPHPAGTRIISLDLRAARDHGWVATLHDVTDRRETQQWLMAQTACDSVTGLWNRHHFTARLQDRLDGPDAAGTAVLMLDLKRFRQILDQQGLQVADTLLRLVGKRLRGILRPDDGLARFASDEFAILVTGMNSAAGIQELSGRIAALLSRSFSIEGVSISTGAHIGIARAPEHGDDADTLIAHAGLALSAARSEARGLFRFFDAGLGEQAKWRRDLDADLRHALARGEFELHYQPQIDLLSGRIAGFEALLRWRRPKHGLLGPALFISAAEDLGLIGDIGEWVLHQACAEAMTWPDGISVAVNVSPLQIEAGQFGETVRRALSATGLPGSRLEVEITETLLLRHDGLVLETLSDLRALGVRIALDDFGTGYASFGQLPRFQFDRIKIDRSFVNAPDDQAGHGAIVRAIAAIGASLCVATTAEGVETAGQLAAVRQAGCDSVQGFFYSRPIPPADIPALLCRNALASA